jgi:hypothetical protein
MPPAERAEGVSGMLVPFAAGAAHRQRLCDMLASSNLFGDLVERTQRCGIHLELPQQTSDKELL